MTPQQQAIHQQSSNAIAVIKLIIASAKSAHPNCKPTQYHHVLRFIIKSLLHKAELRQFIQRMNAIDMGKNISINTDMVGVTTWPYLHNQWDVKKRFDTIAAHFEYIASLPNKTLAFVKQQPIKLIDLSDYSPNTYILIDRPIWFRREGEAVLNLFMDDLRVISIAFVFGIIENKPTIIIGAIQGIHGGISTEESLAIFKKITKCFYGLRPRSLALEILTFFAKTLNIKNIIAVADENRHHKHAYFGKSKDATLAGNYNSIWTDHESVTPEKNEFYVLPMNKSRKAIEDIASKKRAMYRRRYEMLDSIERSIQHALLDASPVTHAQ